jgi:MFS family permease
VLSAPMAVGLALTKSAHLAVLFVFLYGFTSALNTTPSMAAALAIVRPRMRGFMTAVVNFIYNLLGAALGGLIVGYLNDRLAPQFGDQAIRYSLLMMPVAIAFAALFYLAGSFTIARDVKRAEQGGEAAPVPA